MGEERNYEEVLEYAISREVDANRFYLVLAERVDKPEMRKVFEDLAEEELEHKAKLELEVMKIGKTVAVEEMRGLRTDEETVFGGPELDMDYKDMLMLAMEKEEASFRTYVNLVPNAQDEESREVLLAIAEEEVKHKLRFEVEYDMLLKKS